MTHALSNEDQRLYDALYDLEWDLLSEAQALRNESSALSIRAQGKQNKAQVLMDIRKRISDDHAARQAHVKAG